MAVVIHVDTGVCGTAFKTHVMCAEAYAAVATHGTYEIMRQC